jgi:hypothetical protein
MILPRNGTPGGKEEAPACERLKSRPLHILTAGCIADHPELITATVNLNH